MELETGDRSFPLWLIGDSNPARWEARLSAPLDPRHPTRHSIWTSVLDVIQDGVYRGARVRIDTSTLYIRNALADASKKPAQSQLRWSAEAEGAISDLHSLFEAHMPTVICCFGAFAFEFTRRALGEKPPHSHKYWSSRRLGEEFRGRIGDFNPLQVNALPLLHAVISRGKFIEAHEYFCDRKGANYFEIVGQTLAQTLLRYRNELPVWIA